MNHQGGIPMRSMKNSVIGNVEGILRDYEDGYKWEALVNELSYIDLKHLVSLAKEAEQCKKVLSDIATIVRSSTEKETVEKIMIKLSQP